MKKRGFGANKLNGYGGKPNDGESIEQAAVRELFEESGVKTSIENLNKVAELTFFFSNADKQHWNQVVHVFFMNKWANEPIETEEMKPGWFDINKLPFDRMWDDDPHWLPLVIKGKKLKATFTFGEDDNKIVKKEVEVI